MSTRRPASRPAPQPAPVAVTLHLDVLNDETFAPADHTQVWLHDQLAALQAGTHAHFLRLGGTRSLHLHLHWSAANTVGVQADLCDAGPEPATARHSATLTARHRATLAVGGAAALELRLPGDPQPYARLTVHAARSADPALHAALHGRAAALGWLTPDDPGILQVIPGGYRLRAPGGTLYHDGRSIHALHSGADRQYLARGGPGGPLGLPRASALTPGLWHVPFQAHDLLRTPAGVALLTRAAWTQWQASCGHLGDPVADTAALPHHALTVTPCESGTLLTAPDRPTPVPTRTLLLPARHVTRRVQAHLRGYLPPGMAAQVCPPVPGAPQQYAVTFSGPGQAPITLRVPLALRVTPTPDGRRGVTLRARQAGLIVLPPGTPPDPAHDLLGVLEAALGRPAPLLSLPPGSGLIGAHVTPNGVRLDFLPRA